MSSPLFLREGEVVGDHAAHARPCPLCGSTPLDVFHFISECSDPTIDHWRRHLELACRDFLSSLISTMARERDRAGREPEHFLFRRIRRVTSTLDFNSTEGDFLLYRLLLAQPWPERVAGGGMRAVRLLGRAFDLPGVYHRFE